MPPLSITQIVCFFVVVIAAACDLRTRKIPNVLTFPAAAAGITLQFILSGPQGALAGIEGWFAAAGIMLATRLLGWPFGMGDVKLVAAIGSFVGPSLILLVFFYFFISLAPVAWYRMFSAFPWRQIFSALPLLITTGNLSALANLDWTRFNTARRSSLLFGPFYAVGTACAFLLERPTRIFLGFY